MQYNGGTSPGSSSKANSSSQKSRQNVALVWTHLLPILFILSCFSLLLLPQQTSTPTPTPKSSRMPKERFNHHKAATTPALRMPSTKSAAYHLGYIAGVLKSGGEAASSSLKDAAHILNLPEESVTPEMMKSMGQVIDEMERKEFKISNLFSFSAFIWCISIVGITASAIPVVRLIAKPVIKFLRENFQFLFQILVDNASVLQPLAQTLLFALCFFVILVAGHYPSGYAQYIALSGCILSIPGFLWIIMSLPGEKMSIQTKDGGNADIHEWLLWKRYKDFYVVIGTLLVLAPTAVLYKSSLIGFVTVAAFFLAIGPCATPFDKVCRKISYRVYATSSSMLLTLIVAQAAGIESAVLQVFHVGFSVWGSIALFLAGFLDTAKPFDEKKGMGRYWVLNVVYLVVLLLSVFIGSVLRLASLKITAMIYFVLWAGMKVKELSSKYKVFWPAIFCTSLVLAAVSLASWSF